ncbi:nuclear transport factor 2 family protein [Nocardioides sp. Kera G14]|uniref:nuclear transport factor 2 family protein n=1 Tax=Nocardioides sp. Kera G14 TaxID=2884264 RepID=UPI001D12AF33|nr:nuclear transport factor 2 family protein [Nocardioides sp. Kera G14]UDY23745.1 nuclear transport factor 2 family protein [Nocardioides sp. Kera G14]
MVEQVPDLEQIKQLKYRYVRLLDTKDWDGFSECFTEDATGDYAGLVFANRSDLVDYMRTNLPAGILTMHQVHHPEITVSGDEATGRWYLQDKVLSDAFRFALEGAAFYEDRYTRTPTGWRIAHTGYIRTFETTYSLDDLPSLKISGYSPTP